MWARASGAARVRTLIAHTRHSRYNQPLHRRKSPESPQKKHSSMRPPGRVAAASSAPEVLVFDGRTVQKYDPNKPPTVTVARKKAATPSRLDLIASTDDEKDEMVKKLFREISRDVEQLGASFSTGRLRILPRTALARLMTRQHLATHFAAQRSLRCQWPRQAVAEGPGGPPLRVPRCGATPALFSPTALRAPAPMKPAAPCNFFRDFHVWSRARV